ncbi:hypothetical protein K431DRAFT_93394 [Polychaeton citri CBS 116435]|uniref:Cora-domain-containing protein n=1 Tax=Polychaeton citri CBS 116435 TaxID=1314669 RepID=A0A9P4Q8I1_9PEZI|nr:hypothetical protein K431DRAFT_93394 [Polychaeton citri CBS 116435]
MSASGEIQALIAQLDRQRQAYLDTFRQVRELLQDGNQVRLGALDEGKLDSVEQNAPDSLTFSEPQLTARLSSVYSPGGGNAFDSSAASRYTGDESDDEQDTALYVQDTLRPESYDHEGLREHLLTQNWDYYGNKILDSVINEPSVMCQRTLFPTGLTFALDGSHLTHCQVFDVAADGSPLEVDVSKDEAVTSKAMAVWHAIKDLNQPSKQRKAVGRISIIREPSPILFGALHYTHSTAFDMDEIFCHLVQPDSSSAHMNRIFEADTQLKPGRIAITRCSSVVALALQGSTIKKIRNPLRRAQSTHGYVYDPWAPYQVLNLQCYPDWRATTTTHDSTKHYVNGVEAFMVTLLGELEDAQRRFESIYRRIRRLVTPPLDFMFDSDIRDKLLFEDGNYTYSRRYFWAYQTMGIMIDSIKAMINAYEDNFTDEVWSGHHRTLWPMIDQNSHRSNYYQKKMAALKPKFEAQMRNLKKLIFEYEARRREVTSLRDQLFSGTSVLESRKSVEQAEITVQQGHNIKLLTLVSIFFLPLTFVTSIFGMSNMPQEHHYTVFAIVTITVCVPFFVLVGSLNTTQGMQFWRIKTKKLMSNIGKTFRRHFKRDRDRSYDDDDGSSLDNRMPMRRTISNQEAAMRLRRSGRNRIAGISINEYDDDGDDTENEGRSKPERPRTRVPTKEPTNIVEMLQHEARSRKQAGYSTEV